jgi:hypothetical protein
VTGQRDPSVEPGTPSAHVKAALDEIAMATAKAMVHGVRIPDDVYAADSSLALWRQDLERRGK